MWEKERRQGWLPSLEPEQLERWSSISCHPSRGSWELTLNLYFSLRYRISHPGLVWWLHLSLDHRLFSAFSSTISPGIVLFLLIQHGVPAITSTVQTAGCERRKRRQMDQLYFKYIFQKLPHNTCAYIPLSKTQPHSVLTSWHARKYSLYSRYLTKNQEVLSLKKRTEMDIKVTTYSPFHTIHPVAQSGLSVLLSCSPLSMMLISLGFGVK